MSSSGGVGNTNKLETLFKHKKANKIPKRMIQNTYNNMPTPQTNLVPAIPDLTCRTDFSVHFLNSRLSMTIQITKNNKASRNPKMLQLNLLIKNVSLNGFNYKNFRPGC